MLTILVCGDITIDWMILSKSSKTEGKHFFTSYGTKGFKINQRTGSAYTFGEIISEMLNDECEVIYPILNDDNCHFKCPHHPNNADSNDIKCNPTLTNCRMLSTIWTMWDVVDEKAAGMHSPYRITKWMQSNWIKMNKDTLKKINYYKVKKSKNEHQNVTQVNLDSINPDVIIIKDRDTAYLNDFMPFMKKPSVKEIYIIVSSIEGLKNIEDDISNKISIIIPITDLRASNFKISHSISWDRLFYETVHAVFNSEIFTCKGALKFKSVIVSLQTSGAIVIEKDSQMQHSCTLIYDFEGQEDSYLKKHNGNVSGYACCLMPPIIDLICKCENGRTGSSFDNYIKCIRNGVVLARRLLSYGYDYNDESGLSFPIETIIETYNSIKKKVNFNKSNNDFERVAVIERVDSKGILEADVKDWNIVTKVDSLKMAIDNKFLRNLVKYDPIDELKEKNIPYEKIGNWISVEREEIEGVYSIKNVIEIYNYEVRKEIIRGKPLSIAVFGSPGSGKSFAIKEITKVLGIEGEQLLTFNLSQFNSYEELSGAFHKIRDLTLKGKPPFVFWDEFDTKYNGTQGGWIPYFLAPMQDGEFIDKGGLHPVGTGIYVFAGSFKNTYNEFMNVENIDKSKDFQSRISAYLNVKGPNKLESCPNSQKGSDNICKIRRAILLHGLLEKYHSNIRKLDNNGTFFYDIADEVIEIFLNADEYYFGARSLENIIKISNTRNKSKFEISSLPPDIVFNMHISV